MGSSPVAFKIIFHFCFRFASFIVFILDFVHNWIFFSEFDMRLCNKYSTVNNFNKPTSEALINSLHAEYFLRFLLSSARSDI